MLELRPSCERCNIPLPPASREAGICSFECTFCAKCVNEVLANVCPDCGGGFVPRPIRPSQNWKGENFLGKYPASTKVKHRPVDGAAHGALLPSIKSLPPEGR
jgi:hypothetical protein